MKLLLLSVLVLLIAPDVPYAQDSLTLTNRNGTVLTNAKILRVADTTVTVMHTGGISTYPLQELEGIPNEHLKPLQKKHEEEVAPLLALRAAEKELSDANSARESAQAHLSELRDELAVASDRVPAPSKFIVVRKLKKGDYPDIPVGDAGGLYEIDLGTGKRAFLMTEVTTFHSVGRASMYLRLKDHIGIESASGFDEIIGLYSEDAAAEIAVEDLRGSLLLPIQKKIAKQEALLKDLTREFDRLEERLSDMRADMPCAYCKGATSCATCMGFRVIKCVSCGGSGSAGQSQSAIRCRKCKGEGSYVSRLGSRMPCQDCRQTGTISTSRLIPCKICGGKGKILCPACEGTGICRYCHGSGKVGKQQESRKRML